MLESEIKPGFEGCPRLPARRIPVGTLHDTRFVFIDNDTRLLFATTYDGDWDTYIGDFVTKTPDHLDIIDSSWDGWLRIREPGAKDYLAKHQITAEVWYVAHPDLTVAEIHRLKRLGTVAAAQFQGKPTDATGPCIITVAVACLQIGHSKSPYSTTTTGACADPRECALWHLSSDPGPGDETFAGPL